MKSVLFSLLFVFTVCQQTLCIEKLNCMCGKEVLGKRIVGGSEAFPNRFPWLTAILNDEDIVCGGAIINNEFVITAAHCFNEYSPDQLKLYIGVHDLTRVDHESIYSIANVIIHPSFNKNDDHKFDIALIKLDRPLDLLNSKKIKPICLFSNGRNNGPFIDATIAGWGRLGEYLPASDVLYHIQSLPLVDHSKCKYDYSLWAHTELTDHQICCGTSTKDTSYGDSGSPLMVRKNGRQYLLGITTGGYVETVKRLPGIYTKVESFSDWIANNSVTNSTQMCSL